MDGAVIEYVFFLSKAFHEKKPRSISTVIVTDYRNRPNVNHPLDQVNFFTFGSFRNTFSAIEQMSKTLAPIYYQLGRALPIITPVSVKEWQVQEEQKGEIYRRIKRSGVICFSVKGVYQ